MTFLEWLQSRPDEHAFVLRMFDVMRIPKNTSKLCKVLRHVDRRPLRFSDTREHFKKAHRAYRQYLRARQPRPIHYSRLDSLCTSKGHTELLTPLDTDAFHNSHLQRGTVILAGNSQLDIDEVKDFTEEHWNYILEMNERPLKPERWERVYTRWGFKHRRKCAICQRTNFFGRFEESTCIRPDCREERLYLLNVPDEQG